PRRKTRIVLTLLKRHGMVREHRGGVWERLADDVTQTDLSNELRDYEERREMDRRKLEAMIRYCRTAQCRTRMLLGYFGEEPDENFRCEHCDNEARLADVHPDFELGIPGVEPSRMTAPATDPMTADEPELEPGEEVT